MLKKPATRIPLVVKDLNELNDLNQSKMTSFDHIHSNLDLSGNTVFMDVSSQQLNQGMLEEEEDDVQQSSEDDRSFDSEQSV